MSWKAAGHGIHLYLAPRTERHPMAKVAEMWHTPFHHRTEYPSEVHHEGSGRHCTCLSFTMPEPSHRQTASCIKTGSRGNSLLDAAKLRPNHAYDALSQIASLFHELRDLSQKVSNWQQRTRKTGHSLLSFCHLISSKMLRFLVRTLFNFSVHHDSNTPILYRKSNICEAD